jgi:hypothetical protein
MKTPNRKTKTIPSRAGAPKSKGSKAGTAAVGAREQAGWQKYLTATTQYYIALLVIATVSIWMRKGFPVHLLPDSPHDDALFLRMARSLKAGDWLGPYDRFTLSKGMVYPLFVCMARFAAIPLKIAEQATYLASSALIAGLVRRRVGNNYLALVLFGLLAFNPVLWNVELARVIREGLYVSLSLAVVGLIVVIAFPTRSQGRDARKILIGVALGFIGGAFWLTREEGIWLLPTLVTVLAVALMGVLRSDWIPQSERGIFTHRTDHLKAIALPFAVAFVVFLATCGTVAGLNYRHYGIFETNEFRARSFLRAYGALGRIQHNEWRRYVFLPTDARQRAYSVSPAARELKPFLDGPLEQAWRQEGCKHVDIAPCSEVPAGWFMWELRDAVSFSGHSGSAEEAMHFYDTLANQIDEACASRKIDCLPPRATMLPPFRKEYAGETIQSAKAVTRVLFTMGNGAVGSAPSLGDVNAFADIVSGVYPPSTTVIQGWAGSASGTPVIRLYEIGPPTAHAFISSLPAQDVLAAYPGINATRFRLETDCPMDACGLAVIENGSQVQFPMARLVPGARLQAQDVLLAIETTSLPDEALRAGDQVKIATILASGYAIAFPFLAILGAVGLLLGVLFQKRFPTPGSLLALGLGSLVAVVVRIALLAYIDATSFPGATLLYTSPATPFVIIFTVVGIYSGGSMILRRTLPG